MSLLFPGHIINDVNKGKEVSLLFPGHIIKGEKKCLYCSPGHIINDK